MPSGYADFVTSFPVSPGLIYSCPLSQEMGDETFARMYLTESQTPAPAARAIVLDQRVATATAFDFSADAVRTVRNQDVEEVFCLSRVVVSLTARVPVACLSMLYTCFEALWWGATQCFLRRAGSLQRASRS